MLDILSINFRDRSLRPKKLGILKFERFLKGSIRTSKNVS